MRAATIVVSATVALVAVHGAVASGGWKKVTQASNSSSFYASASFDAQTSRTRGLAIVSSATGRAHISGTVSCTKGFNFGSYDFDYHLRKGTHLLRVPVSGGSCTVFASSTLQNGGSVAIALYKR